MLQHLFFTGKTQIISQHSIRVKNMTIPISQSEKLVICNDHFVHKNTEKKVAVESEKA